MVTFNLKCCKCKTIITVEGDMPPMNATHLASIAEDVGWYSVINWRKGNVRLYCSIKCIPKKFRINRKV